MDGPSTRCMRRESKGIYASWVNINDEYGTDSVDDEGENVCVKSGIEIVANEQVYESKRQRWKRRRKQRKSVGESET